ncbi:unnamed protein product, partial [Didymodactylos carnosus]
DTSIKYKTRAPLKLLGPDEILLVPDALSTSRAPSLQPVWYSEQTLLDNEEEEKSTIIAVQPDRRQSIHKRLTIKSKQPILSTIQSDRNEDECLMKRRASTETLIPSSLTCPSPTTISSNTILNDSGKENRNLSIILKVEAPVCVLPLDQHEDSFSRLEKQFNEECFGSLSDRMSSRARASVLEPTESEEKPMLTRSQTFSVSSSSENDSSTTSNLNKSMAKNEKELCVSPSSSELDPRPSEIIEQLSSDIHLQQKEESNGDKEEASCFPLPHLTPTNSNDTLQLTTITPVDIINASTTSLYCYSPRKVFEQKLEAITSITNNEDEQARSSSSVVYNIEEGEDSAGTITLNTLLSNSFMAQDDDGADVSRVSSCHSEKVASNVHHQVSSTSDHDENITGHTAIFSSNENSHLNTENQQEKSDEGDKSLNIIQTIDSELFLKSEQNENEEDGEEDGNFSFELEQFPTNAQNSNGIDQQEEHRQSSVTALPLPPAMCERAPTSADVAYRALLKQPTPRTSLVTSSMSPLARAYGSIQCVVNERNDDGSTTSSTHGESMQSEESFDSEENVLESSKTESSLNDKHNSFLGSMLSKEYTYNPPSRPSSGTKNDALVVEESVQSIVVQSSDDTRHSICSTKSTSLSPMVSNEMPILQLSLAESSPSPSPPVTKIASPQSSTTRREQQGATLTPQTGLHPLYSSTPSRQMITINLVDDEQLTTVARV